MNLLGVKVCAATAECILIVLPVISFDLLYQSRSAGFAC